MSLSDREGASRWRPAPGWASRPSSREFVATGQAAAPPKVFVGDSGNAASGGSFRDGVAELQPQAMPLEPVLVPEPADRPEDCLAPGPAEDALGPEHHLLPAVAGPAIDLEALRQESYEQGLKEGQEMLRVEFAREHHQALALLQSLTETMKARLGDAQSLHAPLRRLALHIAEILVRGELQVSGQAIERLVRHCVDALNEPAERIVVRLHPEDADRLQAMGTPAIAGLQIERDSQLLPGSVRLQSDETQIEDLIQSRLESVASRLLDDPQAWRMSSPLLNPRRSEPAFNTGSAQPRWAGRVVDTLDAEPVVQERTNGSDDDA